MSRLLSRLTSHLRPTFISRRGTAQRLPYRTAPHRTAPHRHQVPLSVELGILGADESQGLMHRGESFRDSHAHAAATALGLVDAPSPQVLFPRSVQHDRDAPDATRAATIRLIGFTLAQMSAVWRAWLPAERGGLIRPSPETTVVAKASPDFSGGQLPVI